MQGEMKRWLRNLLAAGLVVAPIGRVLAQTVACDFDIADNQGTLVWGNTIHLTGRPGAGTNVGSFVIINGVTPEQDVDRDGYSPPPGCTYTKLFISPVGSSNLVNTSNTSLVIPFRNIIVTNLPRPLVAGGQANVLVSVDVPIGTAAGTYIGKLDVEDSIITPTLSSTHEVLSRDIIQVEVTVVPVPGIGIVSGDSAAGLDSLLIRGRAGQRAQGVLRLVNTGNAPLTDIRISSTDLRSESAVGIIIPASALTFSAPSFSGMSTSDTNRVTVSVSIPRGVLGGRYRGTLLVQAQGAPNVQIPIIVIVSSTRGIVFENNPVRNINGVGRIAFNGDPGTQYQIAIFDMNGLLVYTTTGTIYPGAVASGAAAGTTGPGADFAATVTWPLTNGRGDGVASGMYLVVVNSIVNGQRQLAKDKLMVIR